MSRETAILLRFTAGAAKQILSERERERERDSLKQWALVKNSSLLEFL